MTAQDLLVRFPVSERVGFDAETLKQQDFWCLAAVLKGFGYSADLSVVTMSNPTPRAMAKALNVFSGNGLHAVPVSPRTGVWTVNALEVLMSKISRMTAPIAVLGPFSPDPQMQTGDPHVAFSLITGYLVTTGKDGINSLELLGCRPGDSGSSGGTLPLTRRIGLSEATHQLNGPDGVLRGLVLISSPAHTPDLADRAIATGLDAGWWPGA